MTIDGYCKNLNCKPTFLWDIEDKPVSETDLTISFITQDNFEITNSVEKKDQYIFKQGRL